jgi:hypothetical protein
MPSHGPPKHIPPKKQEGQGRGPRLINGAALDIHAGAQLFGGTEKQMRAMVARGVVPYRRIGSRIIFLKSELETWLAGLPGVTLAEAADNRKVREGSSE